MIPVPWRRAARYGPLLLLLIAVISLAVHNLGYPGVWYDETVQIWVAQGSYPLGPGGTELGGWRDVGRMNRIANLDPGGYSLWLHVWLKGGYGLAWLRLSAYVFFVLMSVLLATWAFELTSSATASSLAPLIPLGYGLVLSFAFEIRAYSMEMAGVVATGYALHRAVRNPSLGNHLILSAVCSAFLWSRYSFVVVVTAALGALACVRVRGLGPLREELEKLACLLVPVLNSGALIYRFILRYQTGSLNFGRPRPSDAVAATAQAPEYVKQWVLRGQPTAAITAALRENLLTPPALPILLTLGVLAAWPLVRRRRLLGDWPGSRSFPAIATMALLAQLISAALSLAGSYPWNMGQKWSLYLHAISIICVLYLASGCWHHLARRTTTTPALAFATMVLAVILTVRGVTFRRTHWADVSPALTQLDTMALRRSSVFIGIYEVPTVRYFYELGAHRGRASYPNAFRFERLGESPIDARQECLEYVVSPIDLETVGRHLSGARLTRVPGPAASSLSRIDVDAPLPAHCAARDLISGGP